jgi:hypothetical protein
MNKRRDLNELRSYVIAKSNLKNIDPSQCKMISDLILCETKNYLSETTLKRFFGFAQTAHKFSLFTLNTLSQYVGYYSWEIFCDAYIEKESVSINTWNDLKLRIQPFNQIALIKQKNKLGIEFDQTVERAFIYPDFEYFLKSDFMFNTISAQVGMGKSTLLLHLANHFFLSPNAKYKEDIVIFVNRSNIQFAVNKSKIINQWARNIFNINDFTNIINYFIENSNEVRGRIILILDGLDELISKPENFKIFKNFLRGIEENSFLKVLISLRTSNWIHLKQKINSSAFLNKSWYKSMFFDAKESYNIPKLNHTEIFTVLSKIEQKPINENNIYTSLLDQFKTPFWLNVYADIKRTNSNLDLKDPLLNYEMTSYYLQQNVFLTSKSTEKVFLLKKISELCSEGLNGARVNKEKVIELTNNYSNIYDELLQLGILVEQKRYSTTIPTEIIKFSHEDIYIYFSFIRLVDKVNYNINKDFFIHIINTYSKDSAFRTSILSWAIRFCVKRNQIGELKNIFNLQFTNKEKNQAFDFICNVIRYELNRPISKFDKLTIDRNLTDLLAFGDIFSLNYKKTIETVSQNVSSLDCSIIIHLLECNIAIVELDKKSLNNTLKLLKLNYQILEDNFPFNPYELYQYFNLSLDKKKHNHEILNKKIENLYQQINESQPQKNKNLSIEEILCYRMCVNVLFSQKKHEACVNFILAITKKYPSIFLARNSHYSTYLLLTLGNTLLMLGKLKSANKIILHIEKLIADECTYVTSYLKGSFLCLKSNYYFKSNNHEMSLKSASNAVRFASKHNLKIYEICMNLLKIELLQKAESTEEISTVISDYFTLMNNENIDMPGFVNFNTQDYKRVLNILQSYKALEQVN